MKPKNKFQQRVFELSKKLPPISLTQVKWAYKNCIRHFGRRTKKGVVSCLECGYEWKNTTTEKYCICPHCNTKLEIADIRQRVFSDYEYLCIITACEGFQVLRFFYIQYNAKTGEKARYFHWEVVQKWIAPDGKSATIAKLRPMTCFADTWQFGSPLEIRPEKQLYNVIPTSIYPRQKLIPEIRRSGYNGNFYKLTPFDLLRTLLSSSQAETLLKAGQIKLLIFFSGKGLKYIADYWTSIKICLRNSYIVTDASIWRDYIDLLRFFGKDLHNAKYVCPADLNAEHDRYVRKKREWQEQERKAENRKKALEHEAVFNEMKSRFFGIQFTDGLIEVRTLDSVEDVMTEGDVMHHCVFASEYHLKADSLILSACVNGQKIETVEFSLSQMQVRQSRGVCNKITEHHDRIIKLVNKNKRLIQKRITA
jgi:hypothetical protein